MEWTIWAAALAFVLFFLYHSRVEAALGIHLDGKTLRISARVALLGGSVCLRLEGAFLPDAQGKPTSLLTLNGKPLKIPAAKRKTQKKSPGLQDLRRWKPLIAPARRLLRQYVSLRTLHAAATIGLAGDASATARLCGLTRTALECAAGPLRALHPHASIALRATPDYQKDCLRLRASCIISIKIGHIMLISVKITARLLKGAFAWLIRSKASCAPPWKT